jgi:flavin-dependent dehydrogenase
MPEKLKTHEAAVIGGGPAGSTLAILLAQAGCEVILLEKEPTAHHKICGEFISWEAAYYMQLLGIDLPVLGAQIIRHLRLINGKHEIISELPFPGWSLSRRMLDEALIEKALQVGVMVKRGGNVNDLTRHKERWKISIGRQDAAYAKAVFLANGKHELRGWKREKHRNHDLIGFKMHFRITPIQYQELCGHVEIILFDGGYAGLDLVENGYANLCFLIEKDQFVRCGKNWNSLLLWLTKCSPHLARRLQDGTALWKKPLAIYHIPYGYLYRTDTQEPNLFRLGDQMAVIHSFAGDGIAMALHSAFMSAYTYLQGQNGEVYHKQARHTFHRSVRNAQYLANITLSPIGKTIAFPLLTLLPGLLPQAFHAIRLPYPYP